MDSSDLHGVREGMYKDSPILDADAVAGGSVQVGGLHGILHAPAPVSGGQVHRDGLLLFPEECLACAQLSCQQSCSKTLQTDRACLQPEGHKVAASFCIMSE